MGPSYHRAARCTIRDVVTGRELRRLRRRLGWTQERMARELGLSHKNSVYRFESGERRIDKVTELAVRYLALQSGRGRR